MVYWVATHKFIASKRNNFILFCFIILGHLKRNRTRDHLLDLGHISMSHIRTRISRISIGFRSITIGIIWHKPFNRLTQRTGNSSTQSGHRLQLPGIYFCIFCLFVIPIFISLKCLNLLVLSHYFQVRHSSSPGIIFPIRFFRHVEIIVFLIILCEFTLVLETLCNYTLISTQNLDTISTLLSCWT